jgi:hypothetical protein
MSNGKLIETKEIKQFVEFIYRGLEAWIDAGKIVVRCVDEDPDWPSKVCEAHPEINEESVWAFERVGRNALNPRLLLSNKPGPVHLRNLPIQVQNKYVDNPLPLLMKTEDGWQTLQVSLWNLTPDQARQVFDKDGVRTDAAQRAYLETRSVRNAVQQFNEPFRVAGKSLVVMEPCKFTLKQLLNLCAQMQ